MVHLARRQHRNPYSQTFDLLKCKIKVPETGSNCILRYNLAMSHTLDEVRQIAFELPEEERLELANSLLESVGPDSELDEAWKAEAERRIDEVEAGTAITYSWEEVEARLRARLTQ